MDTTLLSRLFREIVLRDGELILPFMGCIKLEDVPASFSEGGLVVTPPSKKLYFDNYSLSSNDILINEYAKAREVSRMAAKKALYGEIDQIRQEAEKTGRYTLEGFGTFHFDKEEGYTIETDPDFMISSETFGLQTIDLRDDKTKEEEKAAEEKRIAEKKRIEEEKAAEEKRIAEQKRIEEEKAAEEKRIAEKKRIEEEKAAEEKRIAEQKRIEEEKAAEEKRIAEKKRIEEEKAAEKKSEEKKDKVEKKKSRTSKVLLWIVFIIAVLVILVLLILIFKEELRPWLEKILYSKEELEILHYKL